MRTIQILNQIIPFLIRLTQFYIKNHLILANKYVAKEVFNYFQFPDDAWALHQLAETRFCYQPLFPNGI